MVILIYITDPEFLLISSFNVKIINHIFGNI